MKCKNVSDNNIQSLVIQEEQYFHVWRSFQFDEATDPIDGYIHKVKQVAIY